MELGEALTSALITDKHDSACYFCAADQKPEDLVNGLTDKYDEDAEVEGVKFENDSGELSRNTGGPPTEKKIKLGKVAKRSITAAHHLVPGNAALKPSKLMEEKWLWDEGMKKGNIGYDVNSRPNGVWLPGNYAVRPWSSRGDDFKKRYAFASIEKWDRQFHDAHPDYSEEVKNALNKIALKLKNTEDVWCEKAKKKKGSSPEERNPLYGLVARLHTLSGRLKRFLVAPKKNWNKQLYTSRFSLEYMDSIFGPDDN